MRPYQEAQMTRTMERLGGVLKQAEVRCARYIVGETLERKMDMAFVQHVGICLHQLTRFQREQHFNENRDELMSYMKDAITQLHELSNFLNETMEAVSDFRRRFFEREERWVRMLMVSLIGLFVNICADNIRHALHEIDTNLEKMNAFNMQHASSRKACTYRHLRVVE